MEPIELGKLIVGDTGRGDRSHPRGCGDFGRIFGPATPSDRPASDPCIGGIADGTITGETRDFFLDNLKEMAGIAIDGSRFKAVNTRDKNYTHGAIERRIEQVEASIARYLSALDTADRQEGEVAEAKSIRLKDKLARLTQQMQHLREMEIAIQAAPDRQISLTDPDARAMATSGKGTGIVGYNVQTAVDVEHHLIVAHEVTNVGHDRTQLLHSGRRRRQETRRLLFWLIGVISTAIRYWHARTLACCPVCQRH